MKIYLLLAGVVFVSAAPFASRAIYLDEHIFLQIAKAVPAHPFFPQEAPGMFFGIPVPNFAAHTHPPVGEYVLAALYTVFGTFREIPFHLAFSVFAIIAVVAFYNLAKRFTAEPLYLTLLFAATPAFFVYVPTIMMDIPMLAFLLAGFALYYSPPQLRSASSEEESRRAALPLAAICFTLALGTGYSAAVPLTCFFIGLLAARRPKRELLAVAAAPVVIALWLIAMTIHFGEFPLVRTAQFFVTQGSMRHMIENRALVQRLVDTGRMLGNHILATLTFLGGVTVFPWLAVSKRVWPIIMLFLLAGLYAPWPSYVYPIWIAVLASAGVAILVVFGQSAKRLVASGANSGEAFLLLWLPATLLFFIVVADMINARYILLSIPALYLIAFRETGKLRLIGMLIPTAFLSLIVAYGDFVFVNSNREWVEQNVAPLQQEGFHVWGGAESGLRFYLEQRNIVSLTSGDVTPMPTDLIVRDAPGFPFRYSLSERIEPLLIPLRTFTLGSGFPVRTFNAQARAGFHDSRLGLAPFMISTAPFDRVEISEVCPLPGAVYSPQGPILEQTEAEREFPMRLPTNTKIEYELQGGDGIVAVTTNGLRLMKGPSPKIVWRNFQIVPKQFAVQ